MILYIIYHLLINDKKLKFLYNWNFLYNWPDWTPACWWLLSTAIQCLTRYKFNTCGQLTQLKIRGYREQRNRHPADAQKHKATETLTAYGYREWYQSRDPASYNNITKHHPAIVHPLADTATDTTRE